MENPKLLDQVRNLMRMLLLSHKTERALGGEGVKSSMIRAGDAPLGSCGVACWNLGRALQILFHT